MIFKLSQNKACFHFNISSMVRQYKICSNICSHAEEGHFRAPSVHRFWSTSWPLMAGFIRVWGELTCIQSLQNIFHGFLFVCVFVWLFKTSPYACNSICCCFSICFCVLFFFFCFFLSPSGLFGLRTSCCCVCSSSRIMPTCFWWRVAWWPWQVRRRKPAGVVTVMAAVRRLV